ncbi:MAG: hypothetical protein CL802_02115 [Citromicrobium sp.]|nr:hypothetical protein [Citromicrobium sp.]
MEWKVMNVIVHGHSLDMDDAGFVGWLRSLRSPTHCNDGSNRSDDGCGGGDDGEVKQHISSV